MTDQTTRFAAVIGHSDTPELLDQCIRHHLGVGVERILVSLNKEAESLTEAFAQDERVRIFVAAASKDPFLYFTGALRQLINWCAPEWTIFSDSDEFWLPRGGNLAMLAHLRDKDLFITERFNIPVLRATDGSYRTPDLSVPQKLPLISRREEIEAAYLAGDTQIPWIMGVDAPKLMVRTALVEEIGSGGHSITASNPGLRWHHPDDLLILHAPFTTEARFKTKIAALRNVFANYGDRFHARQAWHWRRWMELDEAGLQAEFRRQSFRETAVPALMQQGVLALPDAQYGKLAALAAGLRGDALQEALGRAIKNYTDPRLAVAPAHPPAEPKKTASTLYAPERQVQSADDCIFYHCMDIPGHGEVLGQWDLRGHESTYLGNVDLRGKRVLEIGPASGALSFWMESQGADVTSFDLDETQDWDIVDCPGYEKGQVVASRQDIIRKINNAWWFTRARLGAKAKVIYGTVYELDKIPLTYDVVTVNSVLLHLRDPYRALAQAAARTHGTLVITDLAAAHFLPEGSPLLTEPCMHFLPRFSNRGPLDTWWMVPEALTKEIVQLLGFQSLTLTYHRQRFMPDQDWKLYTIIARK